MPNMDFDDEIGGYRNANHPDSSGAGTQKVQKTVKIPQVRDRDHSDEFSQLEANVR